MTSQQIVTLRWMSLSSSTLFRPPGRRWANVRLNYLLADCTLRKGQHQKDCGNIEAFTQEITHSSRLLLFICVCGCVCVCESVSGSVCVLQVFLSKKTGAVDWKWVTLTIFVPKWEPVERQKAQILSSLLQRTDLLRQKNIIVCKSF